jgi:peptidyl-tRNA hydrolase, PTH1 family
VWLIVGLGNPGERYERTRHNIGFLAVDRLAARLGSQFKSGRANCLLAEGNLAGTKVALAKPQTFMNLSGNSVSLLRGWYKLEPPRILAVYDDLDLPFGRLRLRENGSAGTHNGMRSIVAQLGSTQFPRLRIGIDRPPGKMDAADYVLARFSRDEEALMPELLDRVADALELIVREGMTAAMNRYNA